MRRVVLLVGGLVLLGLIAVGGWLAVDVSAESNGTGPRSVACSQALTGVIADVPGVRSVSVDCRFGFGTSSQEQTVHLQTTDQAAARSTAEQVLRALAASPKVDAGWQVPAHYELADGTEVDDVLNGLGFGYVPVVGVIRAQWGIRPEK